MSKLANSIVDVVGVPVFVLEPDASGRWTYMSFNRAAREVSGFRSEDVIGKTAEEVYPGRGGEIAYERHNQVARSKKAITYEVLLPFGDETRLVRSTLEPIMDASGTVTHLVGTSFDLSRNEFLSSLQANAQILNSEIEEFVSIAAHDLRSPLTKIRGLAGLIKHNFEDMGDGKLELIETLERVSIKSFELVAEVLAYTQVSNLSEETSRFDLRQIGLEIMAVLDPDGQHKVFMDEVWLQADRTALQIVLRNLIDNAIKHADREHVEIRVSVEKGENGFMQFAVKDNGKGIDAASLALMESTRVASHSGFGLASMKRLIKARGGTLTIDSKGEGQGATIRFTFPGDVQRTLVSAAAS